jgi:hypothetical protein
MSLREGDLKDTVLSKVSIDEFEPKTGSAEDVMVLGFYVSESAVGEDLYHFISGSTVDVRDVEVSPNPNEDDYYMVFVELDRNESVKGKIEEILKDMGRLTGDLKWKAKTYLNDEYVPFGEQLDSFLITDPEHYITREEFEAQQAQEAELRLEEERMAEEKALAENNSNAILEFLRPTNLLQAGVNNGKLNMQDARNILSLEVIDFGEGKSLLQNYGISESAIKTNFDFTLFSTLKTMLGEMKALPIDDYIVIYNPADQTNVLLTKAV